MVHKPLLDKALFQSADNLFLIAISAYKHQGGIVRTLSGFNPIILAGIVQESGSIRETHPTLASK